MERAHDGSGPDGAGGSRVAVAAHIASQSEDLKRLARKHQLATLAYLLDMARLEAETACRTQAPAET